MSFQLQKPSLFLSPYIKQYWAIENCQQKEDKHIQRIIPNGLIELSFYFGNTPDHSDQNKNIEDKTILSGHITSYHDLIITGNLSMFSVSFKPQGVMMFFDIPLNELFEQQVPLKNLLKGQIDQLESNLFESKIFSRKVKLIENFLINQFRKKYKKFEANRMDCCIKKIDASKGRINVDQLASFACLSKKQFERTFLNNIGISPKKFLRIVRFQNAIYTKQVNQNKTLTNLAYDCGYFDQSHMINDFKYLSGLTPTQFFLECEPYSDYFSV